MRTIGACGPTLTPETLRYAQRGSEGARRLRSEIVSAPFPRFAAATLFGMTRQKLRWIHIAGFTSIYEATVELRDLNVLVGANGAGKSNLIKALEMVVRIVDGELGLFTGVAGGASALRAVDFPASASIRLRLHFSDVNYNADLIPAAGDELIFAEESVSALDGELGRPLARGYRETMLPNPDAPWYALAAEVIEAIRGWHVYHFNDTGPTAEVKKNGYAADNQVLRPNAGNLAAVLRRLQDGDHKSYQRILRMVQQVAPFFRDFVLEPELSPERIRLRWRQVGTETVFPADAFSDGTLRFICLATLLLQAELPGLIVLDEPELGLHPFAIVQLGEMLRSVSHESQVLLATQSVTLMNQFELADLIVVERRNGKSVFDRPDPDRLRDWLAEYSLGDLWEKNVLGGRPRPAMPRGLGF
jgi:predicted ATPase